MVTPTIGEVGEDLTFPGCFPLKNKEFAMSGIMSSSATVAVRRRSPAGESDGRSSPSRALESSGRPAKVDGWPGAAPGPRAISKTGYYWSTKRDCAPAPPAPSR